MRLVLRLVGAALLGFFRPHPEAVPAHLSLVTKRRCLLSPLIGHFSPGRRVRIVVACILASAMSCLAAGFNATDHRR